MNNRVCGKTMETLRKRVKFRLVNNAICFTEDI